MDPPTLLYQASCVVVVCLRCAALHYAAGCSTFLFEILCVMRFPITEKKKKKKKTKDKNGRSQNGSHQMEVHMCYSTLSDVAKHTKHIKLHAVRGSHVQMMLPDPPTGTCKDESAARVPHDLKIRMQGDVATSLAVACF